MEHLQFDVNVLVVCMKISTEKGQYPNSEAGREAFSESVRESCGCAHLTITSQALPGDSSDFKNTKEAPDHRDNLP